MLQQTAWMCSAMPKLEALWKHCEEKPCHWQLACFLIPPGELADTAHMFRFVRIPGIADSWSKELEQPSRTAALRLSKRMALRIDSTATEKGHTSVWRCKLAAGDRKRIAALCGNLIEAETIGDCLYCSVVPCMAEEEIEDILIPPVKPAPKPRKKKQAQAQPEQTEQTEQAQPEGEADVPSS